MTSNYVKKFAATSNNFYVQNTSEQLPQAN